MKSKQYIIEKIKEIHSKIEGIRMLYTFDSEINFHIIQVSPEEIRRGSDSYIDLEADLWKSFFNQFPNEDILITEVDEDEDVSNVIFDTIDLEKETLFSFSNFVFDTINLEEVNLFDACDWSTIFDSIDPVEIESGKYELTNISEGTYNFNYESSVSCVETKLAINLENIAA